MASSQRPSATIRNRILLRGAVTGPSPELRVHRKPLIRLLDSYGGLTLHLRRAKDNDALFNYLYEILETSRRTNGSFYPWENKSVTAPRLLLETKWRYFASTPEV
jgi:hypothetical protein